MNELLLVRIGEITLKGLNRGRFVARLIGNIKRRIKDLGEFSIVQSHSRIWIHALSGEPSMKEVAKRLSTVFGIVSISPALEFDPDWETLVQVVEDYATVVLLGKGKRTFKLETKRVNKSFPLSSYEVSSELGAKLLTRFPEQLSVKMIEPDITIHVEIRDKIYVYHETIPGHAGLPVGMSGRGMLLLSGGIDSPVAGYMMASRGMILEAIYFHTFPYTSQQALDKVEKLAQILTRYAGRIAFHTVDFTDIQLELNDKVPEDMLTVVMRRIMMRIAEELARERNAKAIITGESLGQVASQTAEALMATDVVVGLPVFRPLIGLDKNDTIALARKIGTFETSILPYDDCCTVFVSKHPKTHPSLADADKAEARLDMDALIETSREKISTKLIDLSFEFEESH
ncbi:MAG TPA: tRNA 4-thiouridine(8) synthase ThiI [Clostridiaceae bacterium]|nr:tRNA 4-thiouridine(8) synthase ThiI [Clostridiaceae bacterium]